MPTNNENVERGKKKKKIMKTINQSIIFETNGTKYEDPHIIIKQSIEMIAIASEVLVNWIGRKCIFSH